MNKPERRRAQRFTFSQPCEAAVGRKPAFVIDVSLSGLRVAQPEQPGAIGQARKISFEWEGRQAAFVCELRWQQQAHEDIGSASKAQDLYHAGFQVIQGTAEGYDILRAIVRERGAR